MDALDALLNRVSVARLRDPAPNAEQRERLFAAALRAPDHAQLRPWRFLTVEGADRERLGELFASAIAAGQPEAREEVLQKARSAPLRAPLLVVVIASLKEHPRVPDVEQVLSAGCAAHALLLAAHAQGLGAMWRTGDPAYDPRVAAGLGLAGNERIVGFLYLGTPEGELRVPQRLAPAEFVSAWSGAES
ncbi:NAD(P)H nitroreductase [Azotobacter beijerinckii]|uniref:Putative NAD(P)H nitroreductase n=1 Tax=Azotobacter beijerinckii TaxID=170623 RepID=A0A1I3ZXF6_9GAMM|nr:NAD(P)H nitroreductase [Azotobacter beijerinckii]MDV7212888.1 NAD(P)H nitroreductase [Azotobacter beijerinckii]SFA84366.1 Nitroreductase [Azotobacter beijerinckii]SFK48743.1 Nitroreductase [Azotobacter beijerinckii]